MGLSVVVDLLHCPLCQDGVRLHQRTLTCPRRHSFDLAKQGYVNLLGSAPPANADTASMVEARDRFLNSGHYQPIADAVSQRLRDCRTILDAGGGTGYYLARILTDLPDAVGICADVSVAAIRRAAKAHPRLGAVVADTWAGLPVRSQAVDAVICIFAPRNVEEFARVLAPGGLFVVVTPNPEHLVQARTQLGLIGLQEDKLAKVQRAVSGHFEPIVSTRVHRELTLSPESLADAVAMGPNAFHQPQAPSTQMRVSLDVQVSVFRRPLPR